MEFVEARISRKKQKAEKSSFITVLVVLTSCALVILYDGLCITDGCFASNYVNILWFGRVVATVHVYLYIALISGLWLGVNTSYYYSVYIVMSKEIICPKCSFDLDGLVRQMRVIDHKKTLRFCPCCGMGIAVRPPGKQVGT